MTLFVRTVIAGLTWWLACGLITAVPALANNSTAPNLIVILADDLGYGDLSSFGSLTINTPQLDQLATNGIRFTQFYAPSSVCTPSRAGLLTGRYPSRMGMQHVFMYDAPDGMPPSEITIAEQLQQAGYRTGLVGKWHLGHLDRYMPWNQGFEEFYGVPFSNDMANFFFYENEEIIHEPVDQRYLTRRYTEKSLDFIERNRQQPFFLYLAHSMPHTPLYVSPEFDGKSGNGLYADVVQELDWSTGQIVKKLRELDLLDNTLIVFSSDNGPWRAMGDHGGSAGPLRDGKGSAFEGGQRVPTIVHWPDQIAGGRVEHAVASLLDIMPTFSALTRVPLPDDRDIDGVDISGLLTGPGQVADRAFYYIDSLGTDIAAYRQGDWKLNLPRQGYPRFLESILRLDRYAHGMLLFNLADDPYEQNDLSDQYPERVEAMQESMTAMQGVLDADSDRDLYMRSTSADRKGYGSLMIRGGMLLLTAVLVLALLLYGLIKGVKRILRAKRGAI